MSAKPAEVIVVPTRPEHFSGIIEMCHRVYPNSQAWNERQLASHLEVFPEGQLVAIEPAAERVVGMAASLIILWDDYDIDTNWRDITDSGSFTNHDAENGRTLYGAEVMVHPEMQGRGVGKKLYQVRRDLTRQLKLLRIRAGARLRGYQQYADQMTAEDYVRRVVRGELGDPTLSFQLKQGFHVLAVVGNYLLNDPASRGHAAVIEWINDEVATKEDYEERDRREFSARS